MKQFFIAFFIEFIEPMTLTIIHYSSKISANFDTFNIITEEMKCNRVKK